MDINTKEMLYAFSNDKGIVFDDYCLWAVI